MTIEEVLDCSSDKLKSFAQQQLNEWFSPMFQITRPELAAKERAATQRHTQATFKTISADPVKMKNQARAAQILAELGMDLKVLSKKKR